jgi:integrase
MPKREAAKRRLSDSMVAELAKGKTVYDATEPGLAVRVSPKSGKRVFLFVGTIPHSTTTRHVLGGVFKVDAARAKVRAWKAIIHEGKDPAREEAKARAANVAAGEHLFHQLAEQFIAAKVSKERRGFEIERDIRRELGGVIPADDYFPDAKKGDIVGPWALRPVADITEDDVLAIVRAKARKYPTAARNLLALIKRMFRWATRQKPKRIERNPAADVVADDLDEIGPAKKRDRDLKEWEVVALWKAAKAIGGPAGDVVRLLMLAPQRKNELARGAASELDGDVWTIPAARMKGFDSGKRQARAYALPISKPMMAIIDAQPQWKHPKGPFLFSTTAGKKPVTLSTKIKRDLDKHMRKELGARFQPWRYHDVRRTVRTMLSKHQIGTRDVREALLDHKPPEIEGTYDVHDFLPEKREALEKWGAKLLSIVEPAVIPLATRRRR